MFGIGTTELVLILFIALLVFGAARLPKIGQAIGQTLKELKKGLKEAGEDKEDKKDL